MLSLVFAVGESLSPLCWEPKLQIQYFQVGPSSFPLKLQKPGPGDCLCFSKSGLFYLGTSETEHLGLVKVSFGSYCPGAEVSGLTPKNSFLATVLVDEYLGAVLRTLILSLWYSTGPGVFSFSSKGFRGDFENKFDEDALYLVPAKAGSWTPGPGYSFLKAAVSSMKVCLLVWVVEHLGAWFLLPRCDSYIPGAGILEISSATKSLTLFLQEQPLRLSLFSSTKVFLQQCSGPGVFSTFMKSVVFLNSEPILHLGLSVEAQSAAEAVMQQLGAGVFQVSVRSFL